MTQLLIRVTAAACFALPLIAARGQASGDDKKASAPAEGPGASPSAPEPLSPAEAKFQVSLTGATLAGRWRLVKEGKLGEEKEDRYSIRAATKVGKDLWLIAARIQYGEKDVTVPVPVRVLWAGDTPVITITSAGLPGLGTYSARVLFHENLYTGTWSGAGHGGFLSGTVAKEAKEAKDEKGAKPGTDEGAGREQKP